MNDALEPWLITTPSVTIVLARKEKKDSRIPRFVSSRKKSSWSDLNWLYLAIIFLKYLFGVCCNIRGIECHVFFLIFIGCVHCSYAETGMILARFVSS